MDLEIIIIINFRYKLDRSVSQAFFPNNFTFGPVRKIFFWHTTYDDPAAAPELGEGREVDHDRLVVVHQSVHDIRSEFHNLE